MNNVPPYVAALVRDLRLPDSQLSANGRKLLQPLFLAGVLDRKMVGRGDVVVVVNAPAFNGWVKQHFPASAGEWNTVQGSHRAEAVFQRRDSKSAGRGVAQSVVHLRAARDASAKVLIDEVELPVGPLTRAYGLAATLITETSRFVFHGRIALVENLEFFLNAETVVPEIELMLNSAGRISDRLIACLARSDLGDHPLVHLPDYDPVGLSDYLRLYRALGGRVVLFRPPDLTERFTLFGNHSLLTQKRRNRELLEQLGPTDWPCLTSAEVFRLIRETGCGLEQEALLLRRNRSE